MRVPEKALGECAELRIINGYPLDPRYPRITINNKNPLGASLKMTSKRIFVLFAT